MTLKSLYHKKARISTALHLAQRRVDRAIDARDKQQEALYKVDEAINKKANE
jgi:hypothetical protein